MNLNTIWGIVMLKKKMMKRKILFVTCLILGAMICLPAQAIIIDNVVVTPLNIVMPTASGDTFSFDLVIDDAMGVEVGGFGSTFSVSGTGLTFDASASEDVVDDQGYWAFGNSVGAFAEDKGNNVYAFTDNSNDPGIVPLSDGDVVARYSFIWDGTVGDYTFSMDFDTTKSYALIDGWDTQALEFTPGQHSGDTSSFIVTIPEPATLMLMCLGTMVLRSRKKRLCP